MQYGSCFKQAFQFVEQAPEISKNFRIVHGIITNPSGLVIAHAWVEYQAGLGAMWQVLDTERKLRVPAHVHYKGYKARSVTRYRFAQAQALAAESDTYGPWDYPLLKFMRDEGIPPNSWTPHAEAWLQAFFAKHEPK